MQRIGAWYRSEYGNLLKSNQAVYKDLFSGVLDGTPPKPHRGRILHFYSRNFYDIRVKERVGDRVAALKRRAELAGEEFKGPTIDFVTKVTADVWETETPQFKHECEVALDREYDCRPNITPEAKADTPGFQVPPRHVVRTRQCGIQKAYRGP
jgi:hypothetical protein